MQIKEAAERSALTERAVRLYEERGLISPHITNKNGRDFRDYDERDLERLKTISALRRALFTIDEIKEMLDDPSRIGITVETNRRRMHDDSAQLSFLVTRLDAVDVSLIRNVGELTRALFAPEEADTELGESKTPIFPDDYEQYAEQYKNIYDKYFSENTGWERRYSASLRVGGFFGAVRWFFTRKLVYIPLACIALYLILGFFLQRIYIITDIDYSFTGYSYPAVTNEEGNLVPDESVPGEPFELKLSGEIERHVDFTQIDNWRFTGLYSVFHGGIIIDGWERLFDYDEVYSAHFTDSYYVPHTDGTSGDVYVSSRPFDLRAPDGSVYMCEMFTTNQFAEIVLMLYPVEGDVQLKDDLLYERDENMRFVLLRRPDTHLFGPILWERAVNIIDDEFSYMYTYSLNIY